MKSVVMPIIDSRIKLPQYKIFEFREKSSKYALCIPVLNEGERFLSQLSKMKEARISDLVDIIICDGGSTDGSTSQETLEKLGITALIIRISSGHLSDQLMLGYYYALINGYCGTITMDGNGKDGIDGIAVFVKALDDGYDLIQGSRYIDGGVAINTPKYRELAIKMIHVPIINRLSGFHYTDTTNGFRAHSIKIYKDMNIQPFRYGSFPTYSLIHYLTVIVPKLGYRVKEIPVLRQYPAKGKIPTKISPLKGNLDLIIILLNLYKGTYNP